MAETYDVTTLEPENVTEDSAVLKCQLTIGTTEDPPEE